jgi:predicted XRE-type DNA-binding protein
MMTTSKAFGITRPGDHIANSQFVQQAAPAQNIEAEKFKILSEAIQKFMNKEISKAELETIQNSLK